MLAHECGHAVQHFEGYASFINPWGHLCPVVNFGSMISWPLIIIGLFMNGQMSSFLIDIGILLFMVAVAFHLITLPVEINASRRAVKVLGNSGMLREDEVGGVKKVLRAAAMHICGKCGRNDFTAFTFVDPDKWTKKE